MRINTDSKKIKQILSRGVAEVIVREELEKKLFSGKKLRIKFGVDPSKPDIHLGHSVPLRKLQAFQELGHQAIFIIGDFTGQIGDPSEKSKSRPQLSKKQVEENAKTYLKQAGKVIDIKKVEIQRNSRWYNKMGIKDALSLGSLITLARILERDDFEKRIKKNADIYLHEIFYPLLQGYDSIAVGADIELGGTDQKFNMLMGRTLQKKFNKPQQNIVCFPLLIGLDGKAKMSKSLNNYIGVTESAQGQYGKIMSIPDDLIVHYFELITQVPIKEIAQIKKELKSGGTNPKILKAQLSREVVSDFYGLKAAQKAEEEFERIFKRKETPLEIPEIKIKKTTFNILDLLVATKLTCSRAEARRLILQKGVKIDKKIQEDWQKNVKPVKGMIIQVGKRKFIKII